MQVYVVMGNDFPDAVFDSEAAAEAYCEARRGSGQATTWNTAARIYWRVYEFELQTATTKGRGRR